MKAVRIREFGGPEVLRIEELPTPKPEAGEVLVRIAAIGVNFIDTKHRDGTFKARLPTPPFTLGLEGAGVVEALGPGVCELAVGDRVGWPSFLGSCASHIRIPAARVLRLPDALDFEQAAAVLNNGATAHYLCHTTYPLKAGETCLVHAAAGGVGRLLCSMAKRRGARVLGTVSTREKAEVARQAGADETILYNDVDFATEARRLTGGKGVSVVFDSVGQTTFAKSLDSLAPRGMLVLFSQASGPVPPIDPWTLWEKGSLFLTAPSLPLHIASREELVEHAGAVLDWAAAGKLPVPVRAYPISEVAQAHRRIVERTALTKLVLVP